MRRYSRTDQELEQWIKTEHYRLHYVERWPDSDYKEAVLAAIRSKLNTLEAASLAPVTSPAAWFAHPCEFGTGAGVAFQIKSLRRDRTVGGLRGISLQKAAAAPGNIAGFAWIVVAFNVAVAIGGAFVRATGSGAGCGNHWPLCNGHVVIGTPSTATVIEFVHRSMTGIDAAMVLGLIAWTFRAFPKRHPARLGAVLSTVFMFSEALIGATLVKFGLVVHDASPARAAVLSLHLVNTLTFLACLTLTAWWAGGRPRIRMERSAWVSLVALILLAISGALAALADSLYPVHSLAAGFVQDLSPDAAIAIKLRAVHPIIAAAVSVWLICYAISRAPAAQRLAHVVVAAVVAQLLAGIMNLLLLAPVGMQLVHLLLANLLWIALVMLCATANGPSAIPVAGSKNHSSSHALYVVGTNSAV